MRRKILVTYALVMAIMLIFPPTIVSTKTANAPKALELLFPARSENGGFRFIGQIGPLPEEGDRLSGSVSMDYQQLGIQILVLTLITGACILATDPKEKS